MASASSAGLDQQERLYKVLVVGENHCGKTSIIKRYVHNVFSTSYKATIGVDFALKVLPWDEHTTIRLQLWDIAGQERYSNMTRVYYREAVGAFVVFDCTRPRTFDSVTKWKQDIDQKVLDSSGKPVPVVLLMNKCDLARDPSIPSGEALQQFVTDNSFVAFFETSAREPSHKGIEEATKLLVGEIVKNDVAKPAEPKQDTVSPAKPATSKGGCCN